MQTLTSSCSLPLLLALISINYYSRSCVLSYRKLLCQLWILLYFIVGCFFLPAVALQRIKYILLYCSFDVKLVLGCSAMEATANKQKINGRWLNISVLTGQNN